MTTTPNLIQRTIQNVIATEYPGTPGDHFDFALWKTIRSGEFDVADVKALMKKAVLEALREESHPAKRIDKLREGTWVKLRFHDTASTEVVRFLRMIGEGEDRKALFESAEGYRWSAYRFQSRWAYGSDAARVSVEND